MTFTLSSVRKLQNTYESLGRDQRIIDQLSTYEKAEIQRIFAIEKQLKRGRQVIEILPPSHYLDSKPAIL